MKGYIDYMNTVEVPRELHERLTGLTAQAKRPAWRRYGAAAAALVLVLGAGAFGVSRMVGPAGSFEPAAAQSVPEMVGRPDIAPEDGLLPDIPELTGTIGGYEVISGDGPTGVASYYMLPYIAYGEQSAGAAADYALAPPDGGTREATVEDLLSLLGCDEAALAEHLDWGGYDLGGTVGFNADGSAYLLLFYGKSDFGEIHLEMMPGRLPIQCCIALGQPCTTTNVWGVEVAGMKNVGMIGDGERGIYLDKSLQTEFMAHDIGVRCTMYGTDYGELEELMSRFVRWAVVEGLDASGISPEGMQPLDIWKPADVGEPNWNDSGEMNPYTGDPTCGMDG